MQTEVDYIIVGQGLAGTLLHFELTKRGMKVLVVDNSHYRSASFIAAGMYNPIVFKRLTKSWLADEVLPIANTVYKELEDFLKIRFHFPQEMVRIFANMEQQNDWMSRAKEESFEKYISTHQTNDLEVNRIPNAFGHGIVKESGWVDLKTMLEAYRLYLVKSNLLLEEKMAYDSLSFMDGLTYKNIQAKGIVFCEGIQGQNNPFFNDLAYVPTKGDLLIVKIKGLKLSKIINKGFFLLPIGNDLYKVGSTYNWKDTTYEPTVEGKQELIDKLTTVIQQPFEIMEHLVGIRPATRDRKPILMEHPTINTMYVFNGLGTKGVMLGPYFSKEMTNELLTV